MILLHVTTPQDLLADLGSPASIYYKEEDKMKIHSETKESPRIQQEEDGILGEMDDIGYDRTNKPAEGAHHDLSFHLCFSICVFAYECRTLAGCIANP